MRTLRHIDKSRRALISKATLAAVAGLGLPLGLARRASAEEQKPMLGLGNEAENLKLDINTEGLQALRLLAVERNITLQAIAIEAFNDVLKKYDRPAVVKPQ